MCRVTADVRWTARNVAAAAAGNARQLGRIADSLAGAPADVRAFAADLQQQADALASGTRRLQHLIEAQASAVVPS